MTNTQKNTGLPWKKLLIAWISVFFLIVLVPVSAPVSRLDAQTLPTGSDYQTYLQHFTSQGITIPTNVSATIYQKTGNSNDAVTATNSYRQVLQALQTRHPDISTLALSIVAMNNYSSYADAATAADSVSQMSSQLQNYQSISTLAAQVAAATYPDDFSDALSAVYDGVSGKDTFKTQIGVTDTAAEVLAVLNSTGQLNFAGNNASDIRNLVGGMTSNSSLQSAEAKDILAAVNIFTPGNFSADSNTVSTIASQVFDNQLSSDVKSIVSQSDTQGLAALALGALSGNSGTNLASTLTSQVTNNTVTNANQYKQLYDQVSGQLGTDQLRNFGLDKAKSLIMSKVGSPQDAATTVIKNTVTRATNPASTTPTTPSTTPTPPSTSPTPSTSPAPGASSAPSPAPSSSPTPSGSPSPAPSGSPTPSTSPSPSSSPGPSPSPSGSPTPSASPKATEYIKSPVQGSLITAMIDKLKLTGTAGEIGDALEVKTYAKNLVLEGYEAYHIKRVNTLAPYMNFSNRRNDVDFSESKIPLLRNSKYQTERLNSAETYYGYNARTDINGDSDILVESAWVAKTSQPVKCSIKLANLAYIVRTCLIGKDETCEALYLGADGQETIRGTKIKIKDLATVITAILIADSGDQDELINALAIALASGQGSIATDAITQATDTLSKIGGDGPIYEKLAAMAASDIMEPIADNRMPFCESLYNTASTNASNEEQLLQEMATGKIQMEDIGKIYLRWAIEKLDFYLAREYRTAYLVQATRICPTKSRFICSRWRPIYKYAYGNVATGNCHVAIPCDYNQTPDQVRVYPFKVPDLFANHNFCNTASLTYPGIATDVECEVSEQFSYTDMVQEYYDPATLQKNFLTTLPMLKDFRTKVVEKRVEAAKNANNACNVNSLHPANLGHINDEPDKSCFLSGSPSVYNTKDLIDCQNCKGSAVKAALVKVINGAKKNDKLYNIENPNGNSKGTDDITDGLKSSSITTSAVNTREAAIKDYITYNDWCICFNSWRDWHVWFAYARLDYYVVVPYSDEAEIVEKTVISPFMDQSQYSKFLSQDKRQNRKITVQGQKSRLSNVPIWLPAGGPISNVLIQQETLYGPEQDIYKGFKKCSSVPSYFETRCAADGDAEDDDPFDDDKSQCILNAEASCSRGCSSAGVESLEYEEDNGTTKMTCKCNSSLSDESSTPREYHYECSASVGDY